MGGVDFAQAPGALPSTTLYSCQPPMPTTTVAHGVLGVSRFNHLAHRATDHHLAQRLRPHSSCCRSCAAHVRIRLREMVAHQNLAHPASGRSVC